MTSALIDNLLDLTGAALAPVEATFDAAKENVRALVMDGDRVSGAKLEEHQAAAHALSWLATYAESLRQMNAWASRLSDKGQLGEIEKLILQIAFGEYLAQMTGGMMMSQNEIARLADMGVDGAALDTDAINTLIAEGNTQAARTRLVELMQDNSGHATFGASGLDEELEMIRQQFRRYADERVAPNAHEWHLKDDYIPLEILEELAEMGVFGLTIPEEYGGLGMSKASMVVVSEELSRGYIGVGSLGTRSEIAAELVEAGGTEEQKQHWLPKLASQSQPPSLF
jgi:(2S)-methylsuccinyl-CoA dehydrogenase